MENIHEHMSKMKDLLSSLEDMIDASKAAFLSNKLSVEKNALFDFIDDLRIIMEDMSKDLPNEIKQARRIVGESEKILTDARNKAAIIIKSAEAEAAQLVDEHELAKKASVQAMQMVEGAKKEAREFRKNAVEYADENLSKAEEAIRAAVDKFSSSVMAVEEQFDETLNGLYETRKELRGVKE